MYELTMATTTTNQILEATLRLIVDGGVQAVRYREVAAAAKVSLGTVSYQYPSREELLSAAFAHFLSLGAANIRDMARAQMPGTVEEFGSLCVEIVRKDFEDPSRAYLAEYELTVFAARDARLSDALAEFDRAVVADVASILEGLRVASPFAAAQTVIEITRGFQLANLGRTERNYDEFGARVSRVVSSFVTIPKVKTREGPRFSARQRA